MLDQQMRQPRFIAFWLPVLFHDQHAKEIIAGQHSQHVSGFLNNRPGRSAPCSCRVEINITHEKRDTTRTADACIRCMLNRIAHVSSFSFVLR